MSHFILSLKFGKTPTGVILKLFLFIWIFYKNIILITQCGQEKCNQGNLFSSSTLIVVLVG